MDKERGETMQLDYEVLIDTTDERTGIRTVVEQAVIPWEGWLVRTKVYQPHHTAHGDTFFPHNPLATRRQNKAMHLRSERSA